MSDHIPFELQAEIMKFLPVKSLIQFRSVSKQWKSLIDSSEFITHYHVNNTHRPEHLFVSYFDHKTSEHNCVSFLDDDDTFPINKFSPSIPVSVSNILNQPADRFTVWNPLNDRTIIRSSNGLFFLYNVLRNNPSAVIWNPTIHKSVDITLPKSVYLDSVYLNFGTVMGFGVCPHTLDPKIVNFTHDRKNSNSCQVEVYTVSEGVWRSPLCNNYLPRVGIGFTGSVVDIDGVIYFLAYGFIVINREVHSSFLIISFDLKSEQFKELNLPITLPKDDKLVLSKFKGSIALFEFSFKFNSVFEVVCNVWMMDNDVQRSVTKLFTINPQNAIIMNAFGFRRSGEILFDGRTLFKDPHGLFVYDPYSKNTRYVGISGKRLSINASFYTESLLLLNH